MDVKDPREILLCRIPPTQNFPWSPSLEEARFKVAAYNVLSNTRVKTCLSFRMPNQIIGDFTA